VRTATVEISVFIFSNHRRVGLTDDGQRVEIADEIVGNAANTLKRDVLDTFNNSNVEGVKKPLLWSLKPQSVQDRHRT